MALQINRLHFPFVLTRSGCLRRRWIVISVPSLPGHRQWTWNVHCGRLCDLRALTLAAAMRHWTGRRQRQRWAASRFASYWQRTSSLSRFYRRMGRTGDAANRWLSYLSAERKPNCRILAPEVTKKHKFKCILACVRKVLLPQITPRWNNLDRETAEAIAINCFRSGLPQTAAAFRRRDIRGLKLQCVRNCHVFLFSFQCVQVLGRLLTTLGL